MNRINFFSVIFLLQIHLSIQAQQKFFLVNLALKDESILLNPKYSESSKLLFEKLIGVCNSVEGVIYDQYSDYYLTSNILILKKQTSNAGVMPVSLYQIQLQLNLSYGQNGMILKSLNFQKEYAVNTENEAIEGLVYDFSFTSDELNNLFIEGARKMTDFYSSNCNLIVENAKKYQSLGEPEKALGICLSIPVDMPCYSNVSDLISSLYTSLSYKEDFLKFQSANEYVSKGDYSSAFEILNQISIYSQFYNESIQLSKKINEYIFTQNEISKRIELAQNEQRVKEQEIILQQERNVLQESINQTNIYIQDQKNKSDQQINAQKLTYEQNLKQLELQSKERQATIKAAGQLLSAYISKPEPVRNTNFYIIR